jgi:ferric-dicitrate binding protein FerR (iron transport regulator)
VSELPDRYDDAELEARAEDRSERRLFWRQIAIIVLIALVIALRIWLV